MGRFLDIAKGVSRRGSEPAGPSASLPDPSNPANENARRLLEAGWVPKVSFGGRVIWERPDTGFYYSEETAICVLELQEIRSATFENNPMKNATLPN